MRKKLLWALLVFGTLVVVAAGVTVWKAPDIAKWYVHDHYAGVTIGGTVEIHWSERAVTCHQVRVTRSGIEAELEKVHANRHKVIVIDGGTLKVDLDKLKRGSGGPVPTISAQNLTVNITKGSAKATLEGTSIKLGPTEVCFAKATIKAKGHTVTAIEGCAKKVMAPPDTGEPPEPLWAAKAKQVTVPIKLPFDIPRIEREQEVILHNVEMVPNDILLLRFGKIALGPIEVNEASFLLGDGKDFPHYIEAASIRADHPWVAPYPVTFPNVALEVPDSMLRGVSNGAKFDIRIGSSLIRIDPHAWSIEGEASCNNWVEALPRPLPPALQATRGNFSGRLKFEVRSKPTPHLEIKYNCHYKCSEEPIKSLRGKFSYEAYGSDNELFTRHTGPFTHGWVSLASLPPHVPEAFRLSEDPGFLNHKGIHVMALQNSLKANLEKGEFVKGGSTISMQLAKNLWLRRHKTVGRKAQEALLTIALESCMSKARIMEMYMNVVEYGPDVYGLGPAVKHYFGKSPYNLEPDEAFYLAMLLPNPRKALAPKRGGLDRARRRMQRLATSGYISEYLVPEDEKDGPIDTSDWVVAD